MMTFELNVSSDLLFKSFVDKKEVLCENSCLYRDNMCDFFV